MFGVGQVPKITYRTIITTRERYVRENPLIFDMSVSSLILGHTNRYLVKKRIVNHYEKAT